MKSRMAIRNQTRNRGFLILFIAWTVPAWGLIVFFVNTDPNGHPPAAFLAAPVLWLWILGCIVIGIVWLIVWAIQRARRYR